MAGVDMHNHMLISAVIVQFYFGVLYGMVLLEGSRENKKYLLGLWKYYNCKCIYLKIIVYLLCAVLPAYIFVFLSQTFSTSIFIDYFSHSLSYFSLGFGLTYLTPKLAQHWKLITFMSGGTELEDKPLESTT
jgi:hypothetical protein